MTKNEDIKDMLSMLDPQLEEHWTADGLPRVDIIQEIAGGGIDATRKVITDAWPEFNRELATTLLSLPDEDQQDTEKGATKVEVEKRSRLEDAKVARTQAESRLNNLLNERKELSEEIDKAQQDIGRLNTFIDIHTPHNDNQNAIREYIDSQNNLRESRASGRSQMDQAMARRTTRGLQRPAFPPKNHS